MAQALLEGIRVVDLSRILAGPWATQMLADFGADVIKVERPGVGDDTRSWGPPWWGDGAEQQSAYFLCCNRGKRSLTVNLKSPAGQAIVRQLVAQADVLVENFRVGQLAEYQLDYASLSGVNPRLVYCSISGFGQTGPDAERPGYDAMIQALGGLMSVTGVADGKLGAGPQRTGVAVADLMCGLYAANAIQAALIKRGQTDRGEYIDLALFDTQLACLANQGMNFLVSGQSPGRLGSGHPNIVPYQPFACSDGHVVLAIGNDAQFARWCELAGLPYLAGDPRFVENAARVTHRDTLLEIITPRMAQDSCAYWLDQCSRHNIPCSPINSIEQAFAEPQARARKMQFELPTELGDMPQIANPLRFARHPLAYQRPPPRLGEHTEQILIELGYEQAAITQLADDSVI